MKQILSKTGSLAASFARNAKRGTWFCADLSVVAYQDALELQHRLAAARSSNTLPADTLLLLEHPPVFTLGRRGGRENLLVTGASLEQSGIPIIQVERGGSITFHGPGQMIAYPIVNLKSARLKVIEFVTGLEEVMIRTAADWGIAAERNPVNRGIWVGQNKLGSLGIAIRRGVSFHGFALNVNPALEWFDWINPCGLKGTKMTSMAKETLKNISMRHVREAVKHHMEAVFSVELATPPLTVLKNFEDSPQQAGGESSPVRNFVNFIFARYPRRKQRGMRSLLQVQGL